MSFHPKLKNKFIAILFAILPAIIIGGLVYGANVYYDLDSSTIKTNEVSEMTRDLTVSGTGNVLFSTSGTISQTGTGQVSFAGNVNATNGLDVSGAGFTFTGTAGSWTMSLADSALTQTGTGANTFTGATTLNNTFSQAGAYTFSTGTGAVSLNGATSVTGTNTFTVGTGLTTLGGNLTVTGTAWTATPTISGLITATSGLTSNGALIANGSFTLGDGGDTGSINTSDWDISTTGALTGISGIANNASYTQTGTGANTFTGATTFSSAGTGLAVTNNATVGGTLGVTGATTLASTLNAGATTVTTLNGNTITTGTGVLTLGAGKTLTVSDTTTLATNSVTLAGGEVITFSPTNALSLLTTAGTSVTLPTSGTLYGTKTGSITSAQLLASISDETGTGNAVFSTSPTLVTPVLGTATYTSLSGGNITDSALTAGRVTFAGAGGLLSDNANLTFATDTLSATKLLSSTSVSTPSLISTGALTVTPASGSNLNVNLATTGDLAVNTNQLYVDTSTGNVGIGTTSPGYPLDVNGVINTNSLVRTTNSAGEQFIFTLNGDPASDARIWTRSGIPIIFLVNDTEKMRIDNNGNVGIGTTAPGYKLDVAGTFNATGATTLGSTLDVTGTTTLASLSAGAGSFTTLTSSGNTTLATGASTTNTFGSGASSINTIGSTTTPGALTLHGATTLDNTFTVSGSNLTSLGGNLTVTGTAWTATPTISGLITATSGLTSNGAVTVQNNSNLTMSSGTGQFSQTYTGTGNALSVTSSSTTDTNKAINISQTGATTGTDYGLYAANTGAGTTNVAGYFSASGATNNYGLIVENGNVGIGTTAPEYKLDVFTTETNAVDVLSLTHTYDYLGATDEVGIRFRLDDTPNPSWTLARIKAIEQSSYAGQLVFETAGNGADDTTTERMRIDKDGNVGIGTTSPGAKLDVRSPTAPSDTSPVWPLVISHPSSSGTNLGGGYGLKFLQDSDQQGGKQWSGVAGVSEATWSSKIGLAFYTQNVADSSTDPTEKVRITSTGNVGIGTTSPGYKLDVAGTFNATGATTLGSTLGVTGATTLSSTLNVSGIATLASSSTIGNLTLANGSITDSSGAISFGNENLTTTGTITSGLINGQTISSSANLTGSLAVAGNATVGGTLGVTGATTLASTLDVTGAGSFTTSVSTPSLISTGALTVTPASGTNLNIALATTGDLAVNTNQLYVDTSTGNVGIGTITPTANLQVAQSTAGVGTISTTATGTAVTGTETQFLNTFKVGDTITANAETHTISAIASDTSMTTDAWTSANTNVAYTLAGGTRFSVLGNGNVGIGTTAPETALHIGSSSPTQITTSELGNSVFVSGELEVMKNVYTGPLSFADDSGVISWINMPVSSSVAVSTPESYTAQIDGTNILTIYAEADGSGGVQNTRVGIGTTGPDRKLDVLDASSPQLRITQADGTQYADFQVDASGDLTITPSGNTITIPDDNLKICAGGACQTTTSVSGNGNLVVENDVEIGGNYNRTCPTGYIWVPGSAKFGTLPGFCVMKYEAKNVGGVATSQAAGTAWVSITQTSARSDCQALGLGYHLISDEEWMTIAENIATTPINDLDTAAGLQLGNGNSNSGAQYAAVADPVITGCNLNLSLADAANVWSAGSCELQGTNGNTADFGYTSDGASNFSIAYNAGADSRAKIRTQVLSNGNIIWDIAGNVWEWTDAFIYSAGSTEPTEMPTPATGWNEYTAITNYKGIGYVRPQLETWTSSNGIGKIYADPDTAYPSGNIHGFLRGGGWRDGAAAGVFTLDLNDAPSSTGSSIGFRCAQ